MAFSFSLTLRSCGEWHKQHIFLRRDGRERKKVFAMQKVNVAKISLHLSRRGKYQFSSCLQITYDQNSEWNCLLQENAMMHQPKKAEAGFVLFGTCTHWPQCNFRMLTFLWQIQKSRQFNQWNWVNQKKNKKQCWGCNYWGQTVPSEESICFEGDQVEQMSVLPLLPPYHWALSVGCNPGPNGPYSPHVHNGLELLGTQKFNA